MLIELLLQLIPSTHSLVKSKVLMEKSKALKIVGWYS